ncbi:MAG: hypothetical protein QXT68_06600 [Halobacteria archaeon]
MGRGIAVAVLLLAVFSYAAVAPAAAQAQNGPCAPGSACENYARGQVDNNIARLNVTSSILKLLIANLSDNGRSLAYISTNGTMTSRHGMAVWEQVTAAFTNPTLCQTCAGNFSQGLAYYANNSSSIAGNAAGTTGRAALAREQREYLVNESSRAGNFAGAITAVLRDAILMYTETQKQIYSSLGI